MFELISDKQMVASNKCLFQVKPFPASDCACICLTHQADISQTNGCVVPSERLQICRFQWALAKRSCNVVWAPLGALLKDDIRWPVKIAVTFRTSALVVVLPSIMMLANGAAFVIKIFQLMPESIVDAAIRIAG